MSWLPISTAPKDGTKVDLWMIPADTFVPHAVSAVSQRVPFRATDMWYDTARKEWVRKSQFASRKLMTYRGYQPSNWMPLPEAPCPYSPT